MRKLFYPLLLATAFVATACTSTQDPDIDSPVDPNGKTAISFSVEEQRKALTRAGFTNSTKIAMRIKSEAQGKANRYTRTLATAAAAVSGKEYSSISVDGSYVRYWDDAYGRAANLSVFAIAVPNKDDIENDGKSLENKLAAGSDIWFTEQTENEMVSWKVATTQTAKTLVNEDLTYSNNIKTGGKKGVYKYNFTEGKYPADGDNENLVDGRMQFRLQNDGVTDGPGKFDKGHLVFNHALSRITVSLKRGAGFPATTDAFKFTNGTNVKILDVPVSGDLDLNAGTWSNVKNGNIDEMVLSTKEDGYDYTLMAQILPDYEIGAASTKNMLTFTIDDNQYFITQKQMYDALSNASGMTKKDAAMITMEQGLNYKFFITVNKTNIINVTAVVESWADVTAKEFEPSNARISLQGIYDSQSNTYSDNFDLYRLLDESGEISDTYDGKNWTGNYNDKATLSKNDDNSWNTNWYFENNKAYYHFRTVNGNTTIVGKDNADVDDYFVITAGPVASTDPHWGAPMTKEPVYNVEDGYTACLSSAIGATSDKINITDQHMMSNITVKLQTTTGSDQVNLASAKVYITKLHTTGNVFMGTGLVKPTGSTDQVEMTPKDDTGTEFTYAIVPQALVREASTPTDDDYVGITIVTGDNNQYYIVKKLSEITASTVSNVKSQKEGAVITRWFPGHTYNYTFTLKKAGIDKITCTVEGWTDVTADNKNISLED